RRATRHHGHVGGRRRCACTVECAAAVIRLVERVLSEHREEHELMTVKVFQVDRGDELEPYDVERKMIEAAGGEPIVESCQSEDEVIAKAGDAEIFWVSWEPYMSRRVMEALPNCRLVVRWGVGYDQIPVKDATELGVAVGNAPAYGTDDVAEHAISL